ncbi:hypothetical protein GEMRC1_004543 [Eukaryota sp. GEM-RC1]
MIISNTFKNKRNTAITTLLDIQIPALTETYGLSCGLTLLPWTLSRIRIRNPVILINFNGVCTEQTVSNPLDTAPCDNFVKILKQKWDLSLQESETVPVAHEVTESISTDLTVELSEPVALEQVDVTIQTECTLDSSTELSESVELTVALSQSRNPLDAIPVKEFNRVFYCEANRKLWGKSSRELLEILQNDDESTDDDDEDEDDEENENEENNLQVLSASDGDACFSYWCSIPKGVCKVLLSTETEVMINDPEHYARKNAWELLNVVVTQQMKILCPLCAFGDPIGSHRGVGHFFLVEWFFDLNSRNHIFNIYDSMNFSCMKKFIILPFRTLLRNINSGGRIRNYLGFSETEAQGTLSSDRMASTSARREISCLICKIKGVTLKDSDMY